MRIFLDMTESGAKMQIFQKKRLKTLL